MILATLKGKVENISFPECFSEYRIISPNRLPINALARLKCQNC